MHKFTIFSGPANARNAKPRIGVGPPYATSILQSAKQRAIRCIRFPQPKFLSSYTIDERYCNKIGFRKKPDNSKKTVFSGPANAQNAKPRIGDCPPYSTSNLLSSKQRTFWCISFYQLMMLMNYEADERYSNKMLDKNQSWIVLKEYWAV
jgi:hypothetical protein